MSSSATPERLSRTIIYQNHWVNLYIDKVRFPNGTIIEQHHLLDFDRQAVMVIAQDDKQRYLMVLVCRYPTGRTEWEFAAGSIEEGEEIIQAGERELLEETGYYSTQHELLYTYNPLNGIANDVFHIVRCRVTNNKGNYDTNEITDVQWFSKEEILHMIQSGEMQDGYTLTAFLLGLHFNNFEEQEIPVNNKG
jgi:ADP-ribose pyrophosphatase